MAFKYKDLVSSILPPARAAGEGAADGPERWHMCPCPDPTLFCGPNSIPPPAPRCGPASIPPCPDPTLKCDPASIPPCPDPTVGCALITTPPCPDPTFVSAHCGDRADEDDQSPEAMLPRRHSASRRAADLALLKEQLRQALAQGL